MSELSMNRRRFLGAAAGTVAGAGILGGLRLEAASEAGRLARARESGVGAGRHSPGVSDGNVARRGPGLWALR
jgi:hypothetical protein